MITMLCLPSSFRARTWALVERLITKMAASIYIFMFVFWPFIAYSFFLLLFIPVLNVIPLVYLAWWWYDRDTPRRGARLNKALRDTWVTRYIARYFDAELIKTADLPPNRNYIIGAHPHGVLCFGTQINLASDSTGFDKLFPGLEPYIVTLPIQYRFPFRREYILLRGIISSDVDSILYVLNKKKAGQLVVLIPGGAEEALDSHPDNWDLTLNHRKGFIKLAMMTNTVVVPCYHFGENQTYHQVSNPRGTLLRRIQSAIKEIVTISPCIFSGVGFFNENFGLLPMQTKITTVVGAPLDFGYNPKPTREEVTAAHQKYVDALVDLFETHKEKCGIAKDVKLNIV